MLSYKNNNSYFETESKLRYNIVWNMSLFVGLSALVGSILYSSTNWSITPIFIAISTLSFGALIYLKRTKNYRIISKGMVLLVLGYLTTNLMYKHVFGDNLQFLWLSILVLFSFFILGKKIGVLVFSLGFILGLLNIYKTTSQPNKTQLFSISDQMGWYIEFGIGLLILAYFIVQIIQSQNETKNRLEAVNIELDNQYKIVQSQIDEKTVLLQEINHRVKNNLQVIISLLRLQESEIESEDIKQSFKQVIQRIMTMSLIHQKMYQAENLSKMDITSYFLALIQDLCYSASIQQKIKIQVDTSLESIGNKTLVPLALLISELVNNTTHNHFDFEGHIKVKIDKEENGKFQLIYTDNSKEHLEDLCLENQLIEALAQQLNGTYVKINLPNENRFQFVLSNLKD